MRKSDKGTRTFGNSFTSWYMIEKSLWCAFLKKPFASQNKKSKFNQDCEWFLIFAIVITCGSCDTPSNIYTQTDRTQI